MFASLKNKIKEETGNDLQDILPTAATSNSRRRISSTASSIASNVEQDGFENKDDIIGNRSQFIDLTKKFTELTKSYEILQEEKQKLEKTNEKLLESIKTAQNQKNLIIAEQDKIQNLQYAEIEKLKKLLLFREQEAVDRLTILKQNQQQMENLTSELERLKVLEPMVDDLQDDLERLRHSSQIDKNNLTTTLAAIEEENSHLKMRLTIVDQSRLETISSMNTDEKIQALAQERKLLEQRLEETQLQLSDIKSSWSGQNLALETQVSRLSRQVAEETTEKRKAIQIRDEYFEKIKLLEFQLVDLQEQIYHRDNKIKLLEEEIDDLNLALRECRDENEEEIILLKNKLEASLQEIIDLKLCLSSTNERLNECTINSDNILQTIRLQNAQLNETIEELSENLENEKEEKLTALLKNAEISQQEEILRKNLRFEQDECNDMHDKLNELKIELNQKNIELDDSKLKYQDFNLIVENHKQNLSVIDKLHFDLNEKNKSIKILNQRLVDMKKTLQLEIKNQTNDSVGKVTEEIKNKKNTVILNGTSNGSIVMDEVNFKYLKHVMMKFLTSREVEAIHLIRAVTTLLHLNRDEEKLLYDTLNWKMSWFGTKPDPKQFISNSGNLSNENIS